MATVYERVRKIIVDQLGVEEDQVVPAASFVDDLNADSLDLVELIMSLEEEFSKDGKPSRSPTKTPRRSSPSRTRSITSKTSASKTSSRPRKPGSARPLLRLRRGAPLLAMRHDLLVGELSDEACSLHAFSLACWRGVGASPFRD